MLKNKRGLSAIVLTLIMVSLVIIAVAIVWYVILNVLEGQTETIGVGESCVGIVIKPESLTCDGTTCTIVLERSLGSSGDSIDGVGITLSTDIESRDEEIFTGDVAATRTVTITTGTVYTNANVRIFLEKEGERNFCPQISSYP